MFTNNIYYKNNSRDILTDKSYGHLGIMKNKRNRRFMTKKEVTTEILKYYVITRIVLIFIMLLNNYILPINYPEFPSIFYVFDGQHYLNIAANGYISDYLYAFFPVVPLLIRYLGGAGFLILNQVCVLLTAYLLYLIGDKHLKLKDPLVPVKFFFISPISIMTMVYYTEALFMFLTTLSYYLYKEKKYYIILGIALGLCSTVRITGSILFLALFILMSIDFFKHNIKFKNIIVTYVPATIISCIYPIFLYFKTGNPFKFIEVQNYWLKESSNIFRILYDVVVKTINDFGIFWAVNSVLTIVIVVAFTKYMIKNRKEESYYGLFTYFLLTIIMICFTIKGNGDPLTSYYRYIFACFPVYFMIGDKPINYILITFFSIIVANLFVLNIYFF